MPRKKKKKVSETDVVDGLEQLAARIQRANALRWVFVRGLVSGLATALGATLIAGLLVWMLYQVVSTLEFVPIINDLIEQTPLSELLQQQMEQQNL